MTQFPSVVNLYSNMSFDTTFLPHLFGLQNLIQIKLLLSGKFSLL